MALSNDLISQFVKITNDNEPTRSSVIVYGTVIESDGEILVQLDGSEVLTPVSSLVDVETGERVTVMIQDHSATITGNTSSPAARTDSVKDLGIAVADKASIKDLDAEKARINTLVADTVSINTKLTAAEANIEKLTAEKADVGDLTAINAEIASLKTDKLDANVAEITYATIGNLDATNAEINNLKATYATIERLEVSEADIEKLKVEKLDVESADIKYANIDFSNIGEAAIRNLFVEHGLIRDLIIEGGQITGELVGVTIKGDIIEGGSVKADKLVVLGEDGLYYKLNVNALGEAVAESDPKYQNGLDGSVIIAQSVTADRIAVTDLVAFGATIGGFHVTDHSVYSGTKTTIDNTTTGLHMDDEGQFSLGNAKNYLRFFKTPSGEYKLELSAESILLRSSTNLSDEINDVKENLGNIGKYIHILGDNALSLGTGDRALTLELDPELGIMFKRNGKQFGWWDGVDFHTGNIVVEVNERAQFGNFAWLPRSDGSMMFVKVG